MPAVIVQNDQLPEGATIPEWVNDFESFTRWTRSPDFPERGRVSFIRGVIRIDLSMEELFVHNRLKFEISHVLELVVRKSARGYEFVDGARLDNGRADLSVEPDVMFVSFEALRSGRAVLTRAAEGGFVSIDGTPELVVEVVSDSSVLKDTVELRTSYFEAKVAEYWLVDAREETVSFDLLKRGAKEFASTRAQAGGWLKSSVFGKSSRIKKSIDPLGNPQFTLEHRD